MASKEPVSPLPGDIVKIKKLLGKEQKLIDGRPPVFLVAKHINDHRLNINEILDSLTVVEMGRFMREVNKQVDEGNFLPIHSKMAERIVRAFHNRIVKAASRAIEEGGVSDPGNDTFPGSPSYYR